MSFSSWPRTASVLALGLVLVSCGGDKVGPEGTVSFIEISPKTKRMYTVGEQQLFSSTITTEAGTAGEGIPVGFVSRDPTLVQVNSTGVATVQKKGGSTWVVVSAGGKSDSAFVEVPLTTCGSTSATAMTTGQVVTDIGATGFCSTASTGDYAVIVHNNSLAASGTSSVEISGVGLGLAPVNGGATFSRTVAGANDLSSAIRAWRRDVAAELRHRRMEASSVAPLAAAARSWYANRPKRASFAAAVPAVGDVMRINVNISGSSCNDSTMIDARVAAISNTAIVLHDPRNPTISAFTDEEYNAYAQMFDSVIHPMDVAAFGAPTDLDNNSRVLLVFTKSVNERTPAGASYYVGGLTHSRDLVPKASCKGSNVAEMFYLLVPDSLGTVNSNKFEKRFVNTVTDATIAHEFQHLINFARRNYLNAATPQAQEEIWLNEGLSHAAEELLFYRRSGRAPRQNFGGADLSNATIYNQWVSYAAGDFLNYNDYLFSPTNTSPFEAGDEVETRGATWGFLRYAIDQTLPSDGTVWYDFVNSGDVGLSNVQKRFNNISTGTLQGLLRDYTISTYTDDLVPAITAKYTQPSWNMRSFYPRLTQILQQNWVWPLNGIALKDTETKSASLQAGAFQVYRFRGLGGTDSFIRVTGTSGTALPAGVTISIVRTQ
jgi:hypothetical protein